MSEIFTLIILEYTLVLLLDFTKILSIKVALLCVIRVGLVIVGINEFVNTEYNKFVVGICVSVLRKSKFKSQLIITFWLLESLDRTVSYRSSDQAELLFGMRYISPTMVFLTVLIFSINTDSNLPSSNIARSSRRLNCIVSFMYIRTANSSHLYAIFISKIVTWQFKIDVHFHNAELFHIKE